MQLRFDFKSVLLPDAASLKLDDSRRLIARQPDELIPVLAELQSLLEAGYHAMGFIAYEAAAALDDSLQTQPSNGDLPLMYFICARELISCDEDKRQAPMPEFKATWSADDYQERFDRVQEHIRNGDSYQLNLTFPLETEYDGDLLALYHQLRQSQKADYSAFIADEDWAVLSLSPELFFEKRGSKIVTRPMKGTRPRGLYPQADAELAEELRTDGKERAENVMIVDLLRNDLGRIALPGSVKAEPLFELEPYPTVWQMTSTVSAELPETLSLTEILKAIFPCGSVTGAPKAKTMSLIAELESQPRSVYCGSMAYLSPDGDAIFNVAIRTLIARGKQLTLSVGSGVVSDSIAADEYRECLLKADFSRYKNDRDFYLFETMRWSPAGGYYLLDEHLNRLAASANRFQFKFCRSDAESFLHHCSLDWEDDMRVRFMLEADGTIKEAHQLLHAGSFACVTLADEPVNAADIFLYHKTSRRELYEKAYAKRGRADDVLLYNADGELTESTMANLALCLDGKWYTPPISSGLLNGTMRQSLLSRNQLAERVLRVGDLKAAQGIRLMNSLRGLMDVTLI